MAQSNDYVVLSVRILYFCVLSFGLLLAAITFHGFSPVLDPVAPVTILDRISYWMGVHEKSSIVVVELGNFLHKKPRQKAHDHTLIILFRGMEYRYIHLCISPSLVRWDLPHRKGISLKSAPGSIF